MILRQTVTAALLCCFFLTTSCREAGPHPVERVIGSFADSLPKVGLPEDADPADDNWAGADLAPKPPVKPLYAEEEAKRFLLPEGYQIEPVLTEPQIEQPGAIAFDGNGRMFVLELRTYMLTADSDGELDATSRISRWEDTDNDGVYDRGTVFADSLVFPRFVLPYGKDCILAMESNQDNVYRYTDTDGDGRADKKELFTNRFGRSGNVEHQQAFLYWGMDNWLYSTVNAFRVRETPTGILREPTGYNRAQWGITHDDDGKLWFLGGASGLPSYFQFPIHYGNFEVEGQYAEGFEVPWGAPVGVADMQGGMDQVRQPDGSLNRVTGAAGNDIYRGDRLPRELYGQLFYGEPVARIVRQVNPVVAEGLTTLHNPYQESRSEFLRSTDPLFRPVDLTTAPDGTLYVTDMYHGIIQEGQWVQKGSYLRTKIEQYQLDKVVGLGRIWRITHQGSQRDRTRPRMLDQKPAELVQYLAHPNGWWRDMAQQLIVLSGDRSLAPALEKMALSHNNLLARFHALWCLEGLGGLQRGIVSKLAADPAPRMRIQALRAGESLYKKGATSLKPVYLKALTDPVADVALQGLLSAKHLGFPELDALASKAVEKPASRGVALVAGQLLAARAGQEPGGQSGAETAWQASLERGAVTFNELCVQCHGADGTGTPTGNGQTLAPGLAGSIRVQAHPEYAIKAVMHGIEGPLDGKRYAGGVMVGNKEQSDQWIADIVTYIRKNLSNEASGVTDEQVARVRAATASRSRPYAYEELRASVPQPLKPTPTWKLRASHSAPVVIGGSADPNAAFNHEGWTTGVGQQPGMWYQIDFPRQVRLTEIDFNAPNNGTVWDAAKKPAAYPRGLSLQASEDGVSWREIAQVKPDSIRVEISFPPTSMRSLKMVLTDIPQEAGEPIPWSMRLMELYGWLPEDGVPSPKP